MIFEYAVDLEFIEEISKLDFLCDYFEEEEWGPGKHRFCLDLALFQNADSIFDNIKLKGIQKERFCEYVRMLRSASKVKRNLDLIEWDSQKKWVDNLYRINKTFADFPVRMAFSKNKKKKCPYYTVHDMKNRTSDKKLKNQIKKLWYCDENKLIDRSSKNLVDRLMLFLCASKKIVCVDPYFNSSNHDNYFPVFTEIFKVITEFGYYFHSSREFVIVSKNEIRNYPEFWKNLEKFYVGRLPENTSLRMILAEDGAKEKLHDRYILSELGGVRFPGGIAQRPSEDTWKMSLLDRSQWEAMYKNYCMFNQDSYRDSDGPKIVKSKFFKSKSNQ